MGSNGEQMSSHCWLHPERFYSPSERLLKILVFFKWDEFWKIMRALQMRSWRAKSAIFPIWAPFFPFEREVSAMWAPKMRSPLFGVFQCDVSAKRAERELDVSSTRSHLSARWSQKLPCAILLFCHWYWSTSVRLFAGLKKSYRVHIKIIQKLILNYPENLD